MKILASIFAVVAVLILGMAGFAYSGWYDVSALRAHGGIAEWFLSTTSHASIERRARDIEVPDLGDEALVLAGINDFNAMCAGCHGAPGVARDAAGQGLNPPAPDLAEEAAELTPAELFWVTRNGIRMTGMPAWGATHDDASIWPVVAFMTRLPSLDAAGYREMLESAAGHGHHAGDDGGVPHSHDDEGGSQSDTVHVHDDGTLHDHGAPQPQAEPQATGEHDHSTHQHNR